MANIHHGFGEFSMLANEQYPLNPGWGIFGLLCVELAGLAQGELYWAGL